MQTLNGYVTLRQRNASFLDGSVGGEVVGGGGERSLQPAEEKRRGRDVSPRRDEEFLNAGTTLRISRHQLGGARHQLGTSRLL